MRSILVEADRERLLARLRGLQPDATPVAGTLTAARMLCHLADQLAVAIGEIPSRCRDTFVTRSVAKGFAVYAPIRIPFGRVKTVPEMLTHEPSDWEGDMARVVSLVSRFVEADRFAPHPVFGRLTRTQWGLLAATHIDHHLRQFGV